MVPRASARPGVSQDAAGDAVNADVQAVVQAVREGRMPPSESSRQIRAIESALRMGAVELENDPFRPMRQWRYKLPGRRPVLRLIVGGK